MSKIAVRIWERDFELAVSFQNYPGETITDNQNKILAEVPSIDYSPAKDEVKNYITKHYSSKLGNDNLNNVFRFIMPKSILIPRTDDENVFAVMCNFKFDMEHGIALIYENEVLKEIGPQDLIL